MILKSSLCIRGDIFIYGEENSDISTRDHSNISSSFQIILSTVSKILAMQKMQPRFEFNLGLAVEVKIYIICIIVCHVHVLVSLVAAGRKSYITLFTVLLSNISIDLLQNKLERLFKIRNISHFEFRSIP